MAFEFLFECNRVCFVFISVVMAMVTVNRMLSSLCARTLYIKSHSGLPTLWGGGGGWVQCVASSRRAYFERPLSTCRQSDQGRTVNGHD